MSKEKSPRNKTIVVTAEEAAHYSKDFIEAKENEPLPLDKITDKILFGYSEDFIIELPDKCVDLLFLDPPYNLNKTLAGYKFHQSSLWVYQSRLQGQLGALCRVLKPTASIYICGDWHSIASIHYAAESLSLKVHNIITWEREKGRGAKANWKNCSEQILFATMSDNYTFNVDAVKTKKKVIAPYKVDGKPKDWEETPEGNFRMSYPSNLWTDLTVPYWSMKENCGHPHQKPEKLLARIILASTNPGDLILDPYMGSGTACVVASKLDRRYVGIEKIQEYACVAAKRLEMAKEDKSIQGYKDGLFLPRNSK